MDIEYTEDDANVDLSEDEHVHALQKKVEALKNELSVCKKEKEEYLLGWQRCQADAINAKKDDEKQWRAHAQFVTEHIMEELIVIKTTFDHAFKGADEENPYTRGFRNIHAQMKAFLSRQGVEEIEAEGKPFDTAAHEAVENVSVFQKEKDQVVVEEVEKGYTLHGKVIRPSKVKVGEYQNHKT